MPTMKEMIEEGTIYTRLYNVLYHAYKDNKFKCYEKMYGVGDSLEDHFRIMRMPDFISPYIEFENSTLDNVLLFLNISQPEDVLHFKNAGKKTVEELRKVWPF